MAHFDHISVAHDYLEELQTVVAETMVDIEKAVAEGDKRTKLTQGMMIARYKLHLASGYLSKSRKLLKDLERLEKVLCKVDPIPSKPRI